MLKKNLVFSLFFCALIMPRVFGATVSCLVIETGSPSGGPRSQYSTMWENNMMDVFFETGHIVSNGRMVRLAQKPEDNFPAEAAGDFREAKENGMDYFLVAIIEQNKTVSLRLFSTKSRDMIKEQVYSDKPRNAKEENDSVKRAIGLIAAQIK